MEQLLQFFIWLPLLALVVGLMLPRKREFIVSTWAISAIGLHLAAIIAFVVWWLVHEYPVLDIKHIVLFKAGTIEIFIDFYFDRVTAVFALIGSFLGFLVAVFSRFYLHREEGFKRYFNTVLLFFLGYNIVVFAGNFETLFIGWEFLGICSFLLIAFYRDRYLPVKNSLKVISLYRLGDICLILAMWMSHHLWHENITFLKLNDVGVVTAHLQEHEWYAVFIALMIVLGAAAKSAQFPFSSWLPRAMEGPTTSSAIFYGSLSVHLGVFLLIRTHSYWESIASIQLLIIFIGVATAAIATSIAKVQSSVKTQVAYSSIAQIGLMFVEVAVGLHGLALVHFAGNAFLRTYQLLVSPSVLSYLIHDQFYTYTPKQVATKNPRVINRLKNSLYILSIQEWKLDHFAFIFLWRPFKWIGKQVHVLSGKTVTAFLAALFLAGLYCNLYPLNVPEAVTAVLPLLFSLVGFALILYVFAHRGDALTAWTSLVAGQLYITLSISILNVDFDKTQVFLYLSGVVLCAAVGYGCLKKISSIDNDIRLDRFHGYSYDEPITGLVFLVACLGLAGLPFTPTFIGIDLLFSNIHKQDVVLIIVTALSFIFIELSILRIYARIFMGQHKKPYHPIAYRSS